MSEHNRVGRKTLLLLLLTCLGAPAVAAPEGGPVVTLESARTNLLPYEPLPVTVVFHNTGPREVSFVMEPRIRVIDEAGRQIDWQNGYVPVPGYVSPEPTLLAPGQTRSYSIELFWQDSYPVFEKPGRHRVLARWYHGGETRESEPLDVTVREPQGADRECHDVIEAHRFAMMFPLDSLGPLLMDAYVKQSERPRESWSGAGLNAHVERDVRRLLAVTRRCDGSRYVAYLETALLGALELTGPNESLGFRPEGWWGLERELKGAIIAIGLKHLRSRTQPRPAFAFAKHVARTDPQRALEILNETASANPDAYVLSRIQILEASLLRTGE